MIRDTQVYTWKSSAIVSENMNLHQSLSENKNKLAPCLNYHTMWGAKDQQ